MRLALDERRISRFQLFGTAVVVSVLVLGLGFFFIRQITAEYEASIQALGVQQVLQNQELLVRQVETAKGFLANMRSHTEAVLKAANREQVDQAYRVAETIYQREKGRRPDAEIKALIVEPSRAGPMGSSTHVPSMPSMKK